MKKMEAEERAELLTHYCLLGRLQAEADREPNPDYPEDSIRRDFAKELLAWMNREKKRF
ncbi:MAG: hypothetical protein M0P69_13055 [Bacteroidales bacterium]|nr:hypothetical protein [Bacteroidales bacterium]